MRLRTETQARFVTGQRREVTGHYRLERRAVSGLEAALSVVIRGKKHRKPAMARSKPYPASIDPGPHLVSEPLARARQQLLELAPGGSAARPLDVTSAAVIEPKAESTLCPRCSDHFVVERHEAPFGRGVREVAVHCRFCGERRSLWFRVNAPS